MIVYKYTSDKATLCGEQAVLNKLITNYKLRNHI